MSEYSLSNLMKYNCAFQITSFDCDEVTLPDWKSNFSLARSSVTPNWHTGTCSKWNYEYFASLFHRWRGDPTHHQNEYNWWPKVQLVKKIQDILLERNVYIRELKTVMEFVRRNHGQLQHFYI